MLSNSFRSRSSIRDSAFANLCSSAHSLPLAPHGGSFFSAGRGLGLGANVSAYVASECAELNSIKFMARAILWRNETQETQKAK